MRRLKLLISNNLFNIRFCFCFRFYHCWKSTFTLVHNVEKGISIFESFSDNGYSLLIFHQNVASCMFSKSIFCVLSSRSSKNCTLASISISGNTLSSTEKSHSTQAFTRRLFKSGKYLPIESTTDNKWSYLDCEWAFIIFFVEHHCKFWEHWNVLNFSSALIKL